MMVSRISLAAFLASALVACSGGDNSVTDPLPADHAVLDNITVEGRATRPASASEIANLNTLSRVADNGSIVRLAELDPVTLDTTGVVFYSRCKGSTGEFVFDSVTLNSPYVKLELAPYAESKQWSWDGNWSFDEYNLDMDRYVATFGIIVDLRETKNVDINVMTYLEAARLRHLMRLGESFADAKLRADREILNAVGLYDEPFNFDKRDYVQNRSHLIANNVVDDLIYEWSANASPLQVANAFGNTGSFATVNPIKEFFIDEMSKWRRANPDHEATVEFMDGFMASLYGYGKCFSELDGKRMEIPDTPDRNMVCSSGKWKIANGR